MKRIGCFLMFLFLLAGCGKDAQITSINDWYFQENEDTNDYSLFFSLQDENNNDTASDCIVDVRIVNDKKKTVYKKKHKIEEDDFDTYDHLLLEDQYLADVRINKDDIKEGKSRNGTLYFTVYNKDHFTFDEIKIEAIDCLPVKKSVVKVEHLPKSINVCDYNGRVNSTLQVEKVDYTIDSDTNMLTFSVYGRKTYEGNGIAMDEFTYKLFDEEGYLYDSGQIYLNNLSVGDKFREENYVGQLELGETYTLKFEKYDW